MDENNLIPTARDERDAEAADARADDVRYAIAAYSDHIDECLLADPQLCHEIASLAIRDRLLAQISGRVPAEQNRIALLRPKIAGILDSQIDCAIEEMVEKEMR